MQPPPQHHAMEISAACRTIRAWQCFLEPETPRRGVPGGLVEAVDGLKVYLEQANGNDRPIAELALPDAELMTLAGLNRVMRFVVSAESLEASRCRNAMSAREA